MKDRSAISINPNCTPSVSVVVMRHGAECTSGDKLAAYHTRLTRCAFDNSTIVENRRARLNEVCGACRGKRFDGSAREERATFLEEIAGEDDDAAGITADGATNENSGAAPLDDGSTNPVNGAAVDGSAAGRLGSDVDGSANVNDEPNAKAEEEAAV